VSGLGFRVWGLGFGVWGLGLGFVFRLYHTPVSVRSFVRENSDAVMFETDSSFGFRVSGLGYGVYHAPVSVASYARSWKRLFSKRPSFPNPNMPACGPLLTWV
jgi:hypothetical protein